MVGFCLAASTDGDMARECRLYGRPVVWDPLCYVTDGAVCMKNKLRCHTPFCVAACPIVCNGCCCTAIHCLPRYHRSGWRWHGDPVETGTHKAVSPLLFACYRYSVVIHPPCAPDPPKYSGLFVLVGAHYDCVQPIGWPIVSRALWSRDGKSLRNKSWRKKQARMRNS